MLARRTIGQHQSSSLITWPQLIDLNLVAALGGIQRRKRADRAGADHDGFLRGSHAVQAPKRAVESLRGTTQLADQN